MQSIRNHIVTRVLRAGVVTIFTATAAAPVRAQSAIASDRSFHQYSGAQSFSSSDTFTGDGFVIVDRDSKIVLSDAIVTTIDRDRDSTAPAKTDRYLVCQQSGKRFTTRDAAIVMQAEALCTPLKDIGRQQGELGREQGRLGAQQSRLSAEYRHRDFNVTRLREQIDRVRKSLDDVRDKDTLSQTEIASLQAKLSSLLGQLAAVSTERPATGEVSQTELGQRQTELGKRQSELGEKQQETARSIKERLTTLCEQARRIEEHTPAP